MGGSSSSIKRAAASLACSIGVLIVFLQIISLDGGAFTICNNLTCLGGSTTTKEKKALRTKGDVGVAAGDQSHTSSYADNSHSGLAPLLPRKSSSDNIDSDDGGTSKSFILHDGSYDYDGYWKNALDIALANNETLTRIEKAEQEQVPASVPSCPKVFIYDLPASLQDHDKNWSRKVLDYGYVFGESIALNGTFRETSQYALAQILEYRIRTSGTNGCLTTDPTEADLFYVPVHPHPKTASGWRTRCESMRIQDLLNQLHHLNPSTACRHFFALSKSATCGWQCKGWWSDPVPELRNAMRIAYSHFTYTIEKDTSHEDRENQILEFTRNDATADRAQYPNLFSVPYPTSVHWSKGAAEERDEPWTQFDDDNKNRPHFMLYIGRSDHGDVLVRQSIKTLCTKHGWQKCTYVENTHDRKVFIKKSRSVFCLEPAGDSPWRKSIADSLSFGCIPVLFSDLSDDVAEWSWGSWKRQGRVLINRQDFLTGKINLYKLLKGIPPELLKLMQETIAKHAQKFQTSSDEYTNDMIQTTLHGLHSQAQTMEHNGICKH